MSQLIGLRQHIKSIKTTRKITHAMRIISMSIYGKLEKQHEGYVYHQKTIATLFSDLLKLNPEWDNNLLFPKDILNSTPLYIIIASSKGLCGGFNSNLVRYFKKSYFCEEHQEPSFITVGNKATNLAQDEKLNIVESYNDFKSGNLLAITDSIIKHIASHEHSYSSITFFGNHFINFFRQKPYKKTLTPFNIEHLEELKAAKREHIQNQREPITLENNEPITEQSLNETLDFLSERYIRSSTLNLLFQSLVAEQSARFLAMDHATTNADAFIEKLTLKYNKLRQSLITRELAELSASYATHS
jgi:F-type H+-transporting ATPase subunit gamma